MPKRSVAAFAWGLILTGIAHAQITLPTEEKPDPATLFANQCGTCHSARAEDGPRQGPNLAGVVGRKAGTYPGFDYSDGFKHADWTWDAVHLDAWLTNPQAVIPGAVMLYQQPDPDIRHTIIAWLQEQH